ncbi:ankyrin repeat domain-containing protein 54-like [Oscarella lobularis]|uniref:ankyrin repeat domain-containing protein 54-like n=1 Tax=Oscarella lobularis TaxID=121494 RepID=UPI0033136C15
MHRMFRPFHSLLRRKEVVAVDLTLEVRNLIERGHDPGEVDEKGQSAIHVCATVDGPVEVLRLLVEQADALVPNKRDDSSMTPLHCLLDKNRVVDPACLKCLADVGQQIKGHPTRVSTLSSLKRRRGSFPVSSSHRIKCSATRKRVSFEVHFSGWLSSLLGGIAFPLA